MYIRPRRFLHSSLLKTEAIHSHNRSFFRRFFSLPARLLSFLHHHISSRRINYQRPLKITKKCRIRWKCINAFIFCVHYLCLIEQVYVFYIGHVDSSSLYETLFPCNILSKHHHHHFVIPQSNVVRSSLWIRQKYLVALWCP
jgi:hypothetical protein